MNFSSITDWLFIGTTPAPEDYDRLRHLGVGLVINMRFERRPHPDHNDPPLPVLWLPSIDSPLIPIPIRHLEKGVAAALRTLEEGKKVYTHCHQGIHRGVAMGAAILIAQGFSPEKAMELIKQRREQADPYIWYIRRRIQRFARSWNYLEYHSVTSE